MPQYQQNLSIPSLSASQILALALGCFQQLGWQAEFVTDKRLAGYTKKTWNSYHDHILIDVEDERLIIISQLPPNTAWDLLKKNKKNVNRFLSAWETVRASATAGTIEQWSAEIRALQQRTQVTLTEEQKEAEEVEAVMNLSSGSKIVTYTIMGINVALFVAMVLNGINIFEPTVADITRWGANYKPYTTGGEWWRLITSTFIHIGIIHIAFNMYALYQAGLYLEPMLGKWRYTIAYLSTGVLASIASIWWYNNEIVSAGASGAIFGLYGVFLALLTTKLLPKKKRSGLLQSIGVFVMYNLLYGARSQAVDNAAHLGGLLSGLIIGYVYFLSFKSEKLKPLWATGLIALATVALSAFYVKGSHSDDLMYQQKVEELVKIENKALAPFSKTNISKEDLLHEVATISQVQWQKAKEIMDEAANYKLGQKLSEHRKLLKEYIDLRIKHTDLIIISLQGRENVDAELEDLTKQINEKIDQFGKGSL
jgi:rhomboid protease GluP